MRHIDEDTITQAVIARHAAASDARLRELMTSLVQHLHAFAREVRLTEAEWDAGLRFIIECARRAEDEDRGQELVLLSDTLGLSTLVAALGRRRARGVHGVSTGRALPAATPANGAPGGGAAALPRRELKAEPCFVRGQVRAAGGPAVADAELWVRPSGIDGEDGAVAHGRSAADGGFVLRCALAREQAITHDGPVGRMLQALGRHPWRPAHLQFMISAPGHERLSAQVFRAGDPYLDSDAVFGVRSALVADWLRHAPGVAPDGRHSAVPFHTLDVDFVLTPTTGDKP